MHGLNTKFKIKGRQIFVHYLIEKDRVLSNKTKCTTMNKINAKYHSGFANIWN